MLWAPFLGRLLGGSITQVGNMRAMSEAGSPEGHMSQGALGAFEDAGALLGHRQYL